MSIYEKIQVSSWSHNSTRADWKSEFREGYFLCKVNSSSLLELRDSEKDVWEFPPNTDLRSCPSGCQDRWWKYFFSGWVRFISYSDQWQWKINYRHRPCRYSMHKFIFSILDWMKSIRRSTKRITLQQMVIDDRNRIFSSPLQETASTEIHTIVCPTY